MGKLAEIKGRMTAASPGPWVAEKDEVFRPGVFGPKGTGYFGEGNIVNAAKYDNNQADIEFVAHSREDMALLLAVVEAELGGTTPRQNVSIYAVCLGLETDSAKRAKLRAKLDAWRKLT